MLRAFAWDRPLGQLARLPLRLIPRELALPVLTGPNRGRRWIVGSGTHACWLGSYERAKLDYVCRIVRRGTTVFDVGAHAGFYTLALAGRVGSDGQVIAIEPDPENVRRLGRHLALNRVGNARIIEAAACDHAGTVRFLGDGYLGHVDDAGAPVTAVRLDDLGEPDLIKLDVEGGEAAALKGPSASSRAGTPMCSWRCMASVIRKRSTSSRRIATASYGCASASCTLFHRTRSPLPCGTRLLAPSLRLLSGYLRSNRRPRATQQVH